jgi:hypothetical protein
VHAFAGWAVWRWADTTGANGKTQADVIANPERFFVFILQRYRLGIFAEARYTLAGCELEFRHVWKFKAVGREPAHALDDAPVR